jgi:hypothetical protein
MKVLLKYYLRNGVPWPAILDYKQQLPSSAVKFHIYHYDYGLRYDELYIDNGIVYLKEIKYRVNRTSISIVEL